MTKDQRSLAREMKLNMPLLINIKNEDFKVFVRSNKPDNRMHKGGINKAFYSPACNKIFAVDNIGDFIYSYNEQMAYTDTNVKPKDDKGFQGIIMDFAFDEANLRIGAVLKDYSMCFWEIGNLKFELKRHLDLIHLQLKIWYLPSLDRWLTIDKKHQIHIW